MLSKQDHKIFIAILMLLTTVCRANLNNWTQFGRVTSRESITVDGPNTIDASTLAWAATDDPQDANFVVEFEGATGVAVYNNKVYAYARYYDQAGVDSNSQIIAYNSDNGEVAWTSQLETAYLYSWSSPAIDEKNQAVLIGSRYKVYSLDTETGTELWSTQLNRQVVNATVCISDDLAHQRAFIADYSPYSTSGKLYCINLDAYEPANPYQPGEIIWSVTLGKTSGNTCAYKDAVVYLAVVSSTTESTGTIFAYDASATTPVKLWSATQPGLEGFFGGVTVTNAGFVYAATYDYNTSSGENNSTLCKVDASDGTIVWSTPTERTNSCPVVVGDRIYISGGVSGEFGSRPKVSAYEDLGLTVNKLWETPDDADNPIGGWTGQPVYANGKLYLGAIKGITNKFSPYTDLYILDVSLNPTDAGFIIDTFEGCGNSPAVIVDTIYSAGYDGLFKFYQPAKLGDIDGDGNVSPVDIKMLSDDWLFLGAVGLTRADLNLDGKVDLKDYSELVKDY